MTEESDGKMHSGCTAVTAFLRLEDNDGKQSFIPSHIDPLTSSMEMLEAEVNIESEESGGESPERKGKSSPSHKKSGRRKLKDAILGIGGSSKSPTSGSVVSEASTARPVNSAWSEKERDRIFTPSSSVTNIRRVLYCANAGDARGVLCRGGKALRLTYDHKGSDKQEAKRIMDAGGFVMSGRVNGVLAVTRSLGDSSMKEFVVGSPYTTETELYKDDEFLILACDGVRRAFFLLWYIY